ncbi:MAG: metal ABC transporter substrate-binding protein [Clostridiales bacterium]|nr:metal ABC transporter substrate-binding protein [Clostridiales bacterium]
MNIKNKKGWIRSLIGMGMLCMTAVIFSGCTTGKEGRHFKEEDKLKVVTTIYPIQNFTEEIAGEKAEIINLVPAGVEPHDFELSTGDMQLLEEADVFIYNGAGMEHFVDKTISAISNKDLLIVEATSDVKLKEASHSHEENEEEHGEEERFDPHTWLSIENAMIEAETIRDALCEADSDSQEYFNGRFEDYKAELEKLEKRYEKELSGLSKNTIVVAHEAFGYLCDEYGLVQEAVEGLTADSEPDSARMKEIIDFCRENDIQVIFFEELVSPKVAETIANEIGARTEVLNPIEGRTSEQEEQGLDYVGMMEQNLEVLKAALK